MHSQLQGDSEPSTPPVTMSGVPERTWRRALAMTSRPPACSDTMALPGPRSPCRMEIWPLLTG